MTRTFLRVIRAPLAASVAVGFAVTGGCGGLSKPYPEKARYSLGAAPSRTTAPSRTAGALRVEPVRVNSPFNEREFVYRTGDLTYQADYYNTFVADPTALLTAATVQTLGVSGPCASVLGPGATASCNHRLETTVTEMYGDFRAASKPAAVVRARFIVLHEQQDATAVAGEWVLEASEPIASAKPADLAAGYGRAYAAVVGQLADRLSSAIPPDKPAAAPAAPAPAAPVVKVAPPDGGGAVTAEGRAAAGPNP